MIKFPFPKLIKWLFRRLFIFFFFFLIAGLSSYYIFFSSYDLSQFVYIFLLCFLFCGFVFAFLFIRLLHSLARIFTRVQDIAKGKDSFDKDSSSYLDEEPGEFYELNTNLNHIHSRLKWQEKIISQESSELEAVISALTGAILAIDQNKKVLFFNNQATLLFSSQKRPYKQELLLSEMIRNPDILHAYEECLRKKNVIKKTLSIGFFDTEEETFIYEITVAPLKRANNKIHGAVGLFYDISNIRKTEKIQLDFITNVSHELRTPLTTIQGYVGTLLDEIETNSKEQIKQFLGIIQRNVQRLVSLLNHFLELSQMESPAELKKQTLSTEEITRSIVRDLHIKNHEIKMDFLQKTVKADRHFLKQILYNLIDNAIKYVPSGRLIEIVWTKKLTYVQLEVRDHGEGIAGRHKSRLFERFYRVDPSRTSVKGAGIGLSIVKQLIEKHGGTIKVQSELREGSVFICSFPD